MLANTPEILLPCKEVTMFHRSIAVTLVGCMLLTAACTPGCVSKQNRASQSQSSFWMVQTDGDGNAELQVNSVKVSVRAPVKFEQSYSLAAGDDEGTVSPGTGTGAITIDGRTLLIEGAYLKIGDETYGPLPVDRQFLIDEAGVHMVPRTESPLTQLVRDEAPH